MCFKKKTFLFTVNLFFRQDYVGCFDQLNSFIGLTFCGKVSYPFDNQKLLSPAYGPTNFGVHIEKDDESLTSYHFKAYYNTKGNNYNYLFWKVGEFIVMLYFNSSFNIFCLYRFFLIACIKLWILFYIHLNCIFIL